MELSVAVGVMTQLVPLMGVGMDRGMIKQQQVGLIRWMNNQRDSMEDLVTITGGNDDINFMDIGVFIEMFPRRKKVEWGRM